MSLALWSEEEFANPMPGIADTFADTSRIIAHVGDASEFLLTLPSGLAKLIITSPPYNIGKAYEVKTTIYEYLQVAKEDNR